MSRKKEFTNRHGKKIKVDEKDAPVSAKLDHDTRQTTQRRVHFPKIAVPKRYVKRVLLILIIGAVGFAVAIIVTADSVKRDYERQKSVMTRSVSEWNNRAPSAETTAKDQLAEMNGALSAETTCEVQGIDVVSWYGPAKQARESCQATADTYMKLRSSIADMTEITSYLSSVSIALEPALALPGEGEFAIISEYAQSWANAVASLEKITPPTHLASDHTVLITKTRAVASAWTQLQSAHADQNASAFKSAEASLTESYGAFRTVSEGISLLLQTAQSSLLRYVDELSE